MDKSQFIREFSTILRRMSEPRHKKIDWILRKIRKKSKRFKNFELNNPDAFRCVEEARDVPVERIRALANEIYNAVHDKR